MINLYSTAVISKKRVSRNLEIYFGLCLKSFIKHSPNTKHSMHLNSMIHFALNLKTVTSFVQKEVTG